MGGQPQHFELDGEQIPFTEQYGWIVIKTIKEVLHGGIRSIKPDLSEVIGRIVYEYFQINVTPHHEHPDDLGLMQALGWANYNDSFDMVMYIQKSTETALYNLSEYGDVWSEEPISDNVAKELAGILLVLDKCKFQKSTNES